MPHLCFIGASELLNLNKNRNVMVMKTTLNEKVRMQMSDGPVECKYFVMLPIHMGTTKH